MIKKSKNIKDIQIQAGRPLVLDGATGTQLIERGIEQDNSLWTSLANLNSPDIVQKVHEDYICAGADIITTNTFRTNPAATEKYGKVFSEKMVEAALQIAFDAAAGRDIIIAGCNPPAEDCYQQERKLSENELKNNHQEHITLLWEYGSDIILNETQSHLDEILIICKICSSMQIPFIISMLIDENLKLL
ncbi:MAG: homocysteine S-methyltransferase family protein, partial [Ignavibacteria bacterium]|nr:homocysteine S-methyltransferase family protein [Ignavibacteria bacterium]